MTKDRDGAKVDEDDDLEALRARRRKQMKDSPSRGTSPFTGLILQLTFKRCFIDLDSPPRGTSQYLTVHRLTQ